MAVLLPIAINWDNDAPIGIRGSTEFIAPGLTFGAFYRDNAPLDVDGDGIITKRDATQRVLERWGFFERKE